MKNKEWFIGLVRLCRGLVPATPEVYKPILPRKIIKPFFVKQKNKPFAEQKLNHFLHLFGRICNPAAPSRGICNPSSTCKAFYFSFFIFHFSFLLLACSSGEKESVFRYSAGEIRLDVVNDSLSIIRHLAKDGREVSAFSLPYPTYRFCCGDLTGDGIPEIGVGVIKPTRFSPQPDKRLFLFHLTEGRLIRPLWMGSHVGARLDDFRFDGTLIRTTERNASDSLIHRTYKLSSFGIKPVNL